MSQDFLTQEEVNQLLRGVWYDAPISKIHTRDEFDWLGKHWYVISCADVVIDDLAMNYPNGTDWIQMKSGDFVVHDELYTLLTLKYCDTKS